MKKRGGNKIARGTTTEYPYPNQPALRSHLGSASGGDEPRVRVHSRAAPALRFPTQFRSARAGIVRVYLRSYLHWHQEWRTNGTQGVTPLPPEAERLPRRRVRPQRGGLTETLSRPRLPKVELQASRWVGGIGNVPLNLLVGMLLCEFTMNRTAAGGMFLPGASLTKVQHPFVASYLHPDKHTHSCEALSTRLCLPDVRMCSGRGLYNLLASRRVLIWK